MSKLRVYDLAKKYNIPSKDFVAILNKHNIPVKNHMSALTDQQITEFEKKFDKDKYLAEREPEKKKESVKTAETAKTSQVTPKTSTDIKKQPKSTKPPQKNQQKQGAMCQKEQTIKKDPFQAIRVSNQRSETIVKKKRLLEVFTNELKTKKRNPFS